ncbi:MAG: hypothetical protein CMG63_01820 [Candidatus Marinimicrobia bacterium]|nr:hypothetical protein [Candidatus Neomarinimicrobiota bacterium]
MNQIEGLSLIEKVYLMEIYFSVSLWEYVSFQKKADLIKYNVEYGYYSLIQWLAIGIGLVSIFGWKTGFLVLSFCLVILQYLSHFTLGLILNWISSTNKDIPKIIFGANIWILVLFTIHIFRIR